MHGWAATDFHNPRVVGQASRRFSSGVSAGGHGSLKSGTGFSDNFRAPITPAKGECLNEVAAVDRLSVLEHQCPESRGCSHTGERGEKAGQRTRSGAGVGTDTSTESSRSGLLQVVAAGGDHLPFRLGKRRFSPAATGHVQNGEELMNEPSAVPNASDSGANPVSPTNRSSESPRRYRSIRVILFSDCRSSLEQPLGQSSAQAAEIASHYAGGQLPVDRVLVTRLFIRALQHAGYDTSPQPVRSAARQGVGPGPVILQGRIWHMQFQERPTPILNVDLSLALTDSLTGGTLWSLDLPEDDSLPFWVGLGCRPDEAVAIALGELQAVALAQFSSASFLEALDPYETGLEAPSPDPGGTHKVVSAASWTATDEGQITATAYESGSLVDPAEAASGARPAARVQQAEKAVKPRESVHADHAA